MYPPRIKIVEYDSLRRRLWIRGQRCHHGAAGMLVAGLACAGLVGDSVARHGARALPLVGMAAGSALMAHDWKDKSIWFERGYGSQP
jgi:hypothetical protein